MNGVTFPHVRILVIGEPLAKFLLLEVLAIFYFFEVVALEDSFEFGCFLDAVIDD